MFDVDLKSQTVHYSLNVDRVSSFSLFFFSFSLKKKTSEEARNDKWLKRVEVVLMMGGLFFCVMMSFSRVFRAS